MVFIILPVLNLFALIAADLYQKFTIRTSIWDTHMGFTGDILPAVWLRFTS